MNHVYTFIFECNTAATIVRVAAEDLLRAYVAVTIWANSKPEGIEEINYTSIRTLPTGKALINISQEELRAIHRKKQ